MKLLLLSLADLSSSTADAITTLKTARALAEEGFEVSVLAPRQASPALALDAGPVTVLRHVNLRRVGLPNTLNTLIQALLVPLLAGRHGFSIVYVRAAMFTFLVGLWGRVDRRLRVVSEHHGWTASERRLRGGSSLVARWEQLTQVWDARAATRVRTVVDGIRDRLCAAGVDRAKVVVIGNACDTALITPAERGASLAAAGFDPAALYVGFLGSLTPWQGIHDVIDAIACLAANHPQLRLLLVGDGPLAGALARRAADAGVGEQVRFVGRVAHERVPAMLGCFDIALLPTAAGDYAEIGRSPLKLREYAAAGRVVLAARIPSIDDLADEPWLHFYRPGDSEDLARALAALAAEAGALGDRGAAARRYAERHFSWPAVIRRVIDELGLATPLRATVS